jgi:ketosteroid isomerase-like protein
MIPAHVEGQERSRRQAMLDADVAALSELLAENMVWVHASSSADSRASFLEGFRSGRLLCFRLDYSEIEIRIYDNAALVTGRVDMEVAVSGVRRTAQQRYVALWVTEQNRLKLAHWQSTTLPPVSPA